MPTHIAIGTNMQSGTVTFQNTKTAVVVFDIPFPRKPIITLGSDDSGGFPVHKTQVTLTGFRIRCKTKWTGEVDWHAMER